MANREHPDESPPAEGRKRSATSRDRSGKTEAGGEGDAPPAASPSSPEPAASGGPPAPGSAAGEVPASPPAGEAPAPGPASMDSETERGISGVLALWGPLIIIGFLVLVLGADDARRAVSRGDAAPGQGSGDAAPADPVPAALVASEAIRPASGGSADPAPEAGARIADPASPEESTGTADPVPPEEGAGASPAAEESGEPAAALPGPLVEEANERAGEGAAASPESSAVGGEGSVPGGPDLAALLAAAGITLPEGADAAALAAGAVEEAPAAPGGGAPAESPPAPVKSASAGAGSGVEPAAGPTPPPAGADHAPGAPPPLSQGDVMWWGSDAGSAASGDAGAFPWRSAAEGPPDSASGPSGWPPRPILVPCVPPYYWCIALPIPVLVPTPPSAY